jgi:hypothetical protein
LFCFIWWWMLSWYLDCGSGGLYNSVLYVFNSYEFWCM